MIGPPFPKKKKYENARFKFMLSNIEKISYILRFKYLCIHDIVKKKKNTSFQKLLFDIRQY